MTDQDTQQVQDASSKEDKKPEKETKVPDYAHVIIVPVANPETAPELLEVAKGIVSRDGGRIIALAITLSDSDAEENRERLDELQDIVSRFQPDPAKKADKNKIADRTEPENGENDEDDTTDDTKRKNGADKEDKEDEEPLDRTTIQDSGTKKGPTITIEFVTRTANAIARGILDQARESGAELIILGVQQSARGNVVLGSIDQAVMSAAPADVLIYRYSISPRFSRVVVPVDGSPASRMAARIGIMIANSIKHCSVEAIYVNTDNRPNYEGIGRIEQALEDVPGRGIVKKTVMRGQNPAATLLSRVDEDDMVIMGFTHTGDFERWVRDDDKDMRRVLDRAAGPVLLAVRSVEVVTAQQRFRRRVISWLRPKLTDVEQEQVLWDATNNAGTDLDYVVLIFISAVISALGLLLNSAAVIIGAMLVAPIIAPLSAFSIGLSTARLDLTRRAGFTIVLGTLIGSLVGVGIGFAVPLESPTAEMMSRVNPTLIDAFVALASGVIAAYATARKDIPAALAGVAIAAALVPPLSTFGLQMAFGNYTWAAGALLLFLTNIICIVVIGTGLFVWLGMRPMNISPQSRRQYISLIIFVVLSFLTILALVNVSQQASESQSIAREMRELLAPVEVANVETMGDEPTIVTATLRTPYDIADDTVTFLQERMESDLDMDIELRVIVERVLLTQASEQSWLEEYNGIDSALLAVMDDELVPRAMDEPASPDTADDDTTEE